MCLPVLTLLTFWASSEVTLIVLLIFEVGAFLSDVFFLCFFFNWSVSASSMNWLKSSVLYLPKESVFWGSLLLFARFRLYKCCNSMWLWAFFAFGGKEMLGKPPSELRDIILSCKFRLFSRTGISLFKWLKLKGGSSSSLLCSSCGNFKS